MLRLSRSAKELLLVLFLWAVVLAQAESLANEHPHPHSGNQHCCGFCHAGPLPFLQATDSNSSSPDLAVVWIASPADAELVHEVLLSDGSSRAPPVRL
jgi:hypothetical protein